MSKYESLLAEVRGEELSEDYATQAKAYRTKAVSHAERIRKCLSHKDCDASKFICRQLEDLADSLENQLEHSKKYRSDKKGKWHESPDSEIG